jgi:phosphate transport system protein
LADGRRKFSDLYRKLDSLKGQLMTMMDMVRLQLTKSHKAFLTHDLTLAREVLHYELRINALETSIDEDCARVMQMHHLRNETLRFVLSILKVNTQCERIGDHAYMMANIVAQLPKAFDRNLVEALQVQEMFNCLVLMLNDAAQGFNFEDTDSSHRVIEHDLRLRTIAAKAVPLIIAQAKNDPENIEVYFLLVAYVQKMERMGELTKNIGEETLFYLEKNFLRQTAKI